MQCSAPSNIFVYACSLIEMSLGGGGGGGFLEEKQGTGDKSGDKARLPLQCPKSLGSKFVLMSLGSGEIVLMELKSSVSLSCIA